MSTPSMTDLSQSFVDARDLLDTFIADRANLDRVTTVAQHLAAQLKAGHKAMAVGNGGSSADAMHFCEELTGRFRKDRPALPAIACIDPGHLTCVANDFGYDAVFSRWVEALGQSGDVLVAISTSGNSANVLNAVNAAHERGMTTIGLLGKDGGALKGICTHEWVIPGATADRIQEIHMLILHILIEGIETVLYGSS